MSIVFICGCLEVSKDGVGDYVRTLARHLIKKHDADVRIVALHDRYVDQNLFEVQSEVDVLRLSAKASYRQKETALKKYIDALNPDLVSLQFVPFSFHNKGLPLNFIRLLTKLPVKKWHIMFHELWVGMEKKDSQKLKLSGFLQKKLIIRLVEKLSPFYITTSNLLYLHYLVNLFKNQNISILPLFSNIPLLKVSLNKPEVTSELKIILFGSLHQGAPLTSFIAWVIMQAEEKKLSPHFIFVGNNGTYLNEWLVALQAAAIEYEVIGLQPEYKIAEIMQRAHLGITTTPYYLTDKSGTVAAMAAYKLPVLCVARCWVPNVSAQALKEIKTNSCINWNTSLNLTAILKTKTSTNSLADVGKIFYNKINK